MASNIGERFCEHSDHVWFHSSARSRVDWTLKRDAWRKAKLLSGSRHYVVDRRRSPDSAKAGRSRRKIVSRISRMTSSRPSTI